MGSKLLPRVWKVVEKASDRAEGDTILLSSTDTRWKVDTGKLKYDERPPATPSLILLKDYKEWYFSALLEEMKPRGDNPKISPDDYVELVDRVEKLSRTGLREPTGTQILALLEKYEVVVPKEVLMSLLKESGGVGPAKQTRALTQRQRLAAPKAEAPPKWNLACCKGLHATAALECRVKYKPSLYYNLFQMHHQDHTRAKEQLRSSLRSSLETEGRMTPHLLEQSSTFLTQSGATLGNSSSFPGVGRAAGSSLGGSSKNPLSKSMPSLKGTRDALSLSQDIKKPTFPTRRPATRATFHSERRDAPWMTEQAPEPIHLCIDATNNTYTIAEYTPRQTTQSQNQKSMHAQRFILNELGSKILMS